MDDCKTDLRLTQEHETFSTISSYQSICSEIVRLLRASMTQKEFSKELGFSFNVAGKWESGYQQLLWSDFIKICQFRKINQLEVFQKQFFTFQSDVTKASDVISSLMRLNGNPTQREFATRLNVSRSVVDRWLLNQSMPSLSQVLQIIDLRPLMLNSWLSHFVDIAQIPQLAQKVIRESEISETLLNTPWTSLVISALQTQILADTKSPRLSAEQIVESVQSMTCLEKNQIEKSLEDLSQLQLLPATHNLNLNRHPKARALPHFLLRHLANHFSPGKTYSIDPKKPSLITYRVEALSDSAAQAINAELIKFHTQIQEIIHEDSASQDKSHVRILVNASVDPAIFQK